MAAEHDSPTSKKHRIIHWNPDAGREQTARRWTWKRIVLWTVGGFFGLLFAAGIVIRVAKHFLGPDIFQAGPATAAAAKADPSTAFITQAKAEQARDIAAKALGELRKLPTQDHPVQLQQLIMIEKSFLDGESMLSSREYARAFTVFDNLNREIDAFSKNVKIKGEVQQAYNAILLQQAAAYNALAPSTRVEVVAETDGNTSLLTEVGAYEFAASEINGGDCFHPSIQGQNRLSEVIWNKNPHR